MFPEPINHVPISRDNTCYDFDQYGMSFFASGLTCVIIICAMSHTKFVKVLEPKVLFYCFGNVSSLLLCMHFVHLFFLPKYM